MKKAFVDTILLGFVLIASVITLIGTVADEMIIHNKINDIKNLTINTALAAAKHYDIVEDTDAAEAVAKNILSQSKVGNEIVDDVTFTWQIATQPYHVDVTLDNYVQDTFWYRFLNKETFSIPEIQSRAEIVVPDPFKDTSDSLAPLAINQCNRTDLISGNKIDFTFTISDDYTDTDMGGFYGIDPACSFPAGNSNFAHFKNLFGNSEIDFVDFDMENTSGSCLVQTSFQNPRTVDPMQLYNNLKKFTLPYEMDVLLFDCDTTADTLIVSGILNIKLSNVDLTPTTVDGENVNLLTIEATVGGTSEIILKH